MNQTLEFFASKGYGVFPYIIIREMSGLYRQIPIHFSLEELLDKEGVLINQFEDESDNSIEEKCVITLRRIIKSDPVIIIKREVKGNWIFSDNRTIEGCVVFDSKKSIYLDSKGKIKSESDFIPFGGILLSMCGEIITTGNQHYDLI